MIDVRYWEITTSYHSVIITSYKTQGHQGSRDWESQTEPNVHSSLLFMFFMISMK